MLIILQPDVIQSATVTLMELCRVTTALRPSILLSILQMGATILVLTHIPLKVEVLLLFMHPSDRILIVVLLHHRILRGGGN